MKSNLTGPVTAMTTTQTSEYLASLLSTHPIVLELNRLGATEEQLENIRFWKKGEDCPFEEWPITWKGNLAPAAISLARAYCALKWIVLDDPPSSHDRDAAYRQISAIEIKPFIDTAERHSLAQSNRAKKKRKRINEDGTTLKDIIQRLMSKPELAMLKAKKLWPHLYSALDEIGAGPVDISSAKDLNTPTYKYETCNGSTIIKFDRFQNIMSEIKNSH